MTQRVRRAVLVAAAGLAAAVMPVGAQQAAPAPAGTATVKALKGTVTVQQQGKNFRLAVTRGMSIAEEDVIVTERDAQVLLQVADGSVIALNGDTKFAFGAPSKTDKTRIVRGKIFKGQLWANVAKGNSYRFISPACVVEVVGTELDVKVLRDGMTQVLVFGGSVRVMNKQGTAMVNAGERTIVRKDAAPEATIKFDLSKVERWQDAIGAAAVARPTASTPPQQEGDAGQMPGTVIPEPQQPPIEEASPSSL